MDRTAKEINKVTDMVIRIAGRLIIYAVLLLLLIDGCRRGYAFGYSIFHPEAMEEAPGTDVKVTVAKGQPTAGVAHMLKEKGLTDSPLIIRIQKEFYDYEILPGTYTLNTSMTSKEILQILNEGTGEEELSEARSAASAEIKTPAAAAEETTAEETTAEETTAEETTAEETTAEETTAEETTKKPVQETGTDVIEIQINQESAE